MKRLLRILVVIAIASTIVGLVYLKWRRRGPGPDWVPATEWQPPTVEPAPQAAEPSTGDEGAPEAPADDGDVVDLPTSPAEDEIATLVDDAATTPVEDAADAIELPDEGEAVDLPATTVPGAAVLDGTPLYDATVEAAPETEPADDEPEAPREREETPFYDESAELPPADEAPETREQTAASGFEPPISRWTIGHAEVRTEPGMPPGDEGAPAPLTDEAATTEPSDEVEPPLYDESAELLPVDEVDEFLVAPPAGLEPAAETETSVDIAESGLGSTGDEPATTSEPSQTETPPYDETATVPATEEAPPVHVETLDAVETQVTEEATDEVVRPGGLEPPTFVGETTPDAAESEAPEVTPDETTESAETPLYDESAEVPVTGEATEVPEQEATPDDGAALSDVIEEALQDVRPEPVPATPGRDAESYLDEGNVYFNVGQYGLAIDRYTRAIEADPTLTAGHYNRANARTRAGDYDRALEDYDQALELTPDDADALNNRGMLHLYRASYDLALRDFNAALAVDPTDTTVMVNRGLAYLHGGDAAQALVDFQQAASRDPDDAAAHYGAGQAAATLGNRDDALSHLRRAMALDPAYAREAAADAKLVSLQGDADFLRLLRDAGARG